VGAWALIIGGGAIVAYTVKARSAGQSQDIVTNTVEQVPVPVGAIAGVNEAPSYYQSISYFDQAAVDANTAALNAQTDATKGNTGGLEVNTSALNGNTAATAALTSKINTEPAPAAPAAATPAPAAAAKSAAAPKSKTYTVRSGDTLSAIAKRFSGSASNWPALYALNKTGIDASAKKRGKSQPYYNHIVSGQRLTLPAGW
jgi:nucleoid-associated protein YgaU